MGEFSITHLLLVGLIFLIFFGPSRLPQLGSSLGKAIRGFKQGLNEIDVDAKDIKDNHQQVSHQQQPGQQVNQTQSQKEPHNS
ncbi:twin-arginine translocase TatA/TatE family subunit [Bdellovibrio sp. HCB209]|uniref:Sec-independent protein translocase subunit TatA/TatB n=1 Tax=Bdellovibrio sp. HCB209 TaxID=3394354 RepID=UPI0039B48D31